MLGKSCKALVSALRRLCLQMLMVTDIIKPDGRGEVRAGAVEEEELSSLEKMMAEPCLQQELGSTRIQQPRDSKTSREDGLVVQWILG